MLTLESIFFPLVKWVYVVISKTIGLRLTQNNNQLLTRFVFFSPLHRMVILLTRSQKFLKLLNENFIFTNNLQFPQSPPPLGSLYKTIYLVVVANLSISLPFVFISFASSSFIHYNVVIMLFEVKSSVSFNYLKRKMSPDCFSFTIDLYPYFPGNEQGIWRGIGRRIRGLIQSHVLMTSCL